MRIVLVVLVVSGLGVGLLLHAGASPSRETSAGTTPSALPLPADFWCRLAVAFW